MKQSLNIMNQSCSMALVNYTSIALISIAVIRFVRIRRHSELFDNAFLGDGGSVWALDWIS